MPSPKLIAWGVGAVVVILLVALFTPVTIVGAGEQAVITRLGAVERSVGPGMHWVTPIIENSNKIDVRTQKEQADADAASKDLQTVHATVAVNYNVNPSAVSDMYSRIGSEYKSRLIDPAIQEAVKASTANYTAEELITKRSQVTDDIRVHLANVLQPNDIVVTGVSIVNFDFSSSFNQAIEAKVTAEQNALAAKNKLDQVKFEAQQTIEKAKASAQAIQIQAQAINSQGGADYVQLQAINKWNGQYPTTYYGSQAALPLVKVAN